MKNSFSKRNIFAGFDKAMILDRRLTHDVAIQYRMGAGFPGDVNRTHPCSIEPCLIDASAPPLYYGQPVVIDATTQGVRPLVAGDSSLTAVYGITVRPFPLQQQSGGMSSSFGSATPPTTGAIDVLKSGYIMVMVYGATTKDSAVYVWVAASSGNHVQGLFEATTSGSTITISGNNNSYFNGAPDASAILNANINVTELAFNV